MLKIDSHALIIKWATDCLISKVYDHIIKQADFLKADGMTDNELKILQDLSPKVAEQ